jgi:glycosyltransferase involved in cell wall biosynthesis
MTDLYTIGKKKLMMMLMGGENYGGRIYENMILESLKDNYDVQLYTLKKPNSTRLQQLITLAKTTFSLNLNHKKDNYDISIKNLDIALIPITKSGKNIIIVQHLDFSQDKYFRIYNFLCNYIFCRLKACDIIVVVSDYWENFLINHDFRNIRKIYNGFQINEFHFTPDEIDKFKKMNGIDGKPIIYLGNLGRGKGAEKSFQQLQDLDVHFVTTGHNRVTGLPIQNFYYEYRDYLRLLKASSLVITMSQFEEGWCRVAHEAMLCKTPVIGSGKGGMGELLESGKQIICPDFKSLRKEVEFLLNNQEKRNQQGEYGYDFVKQFTSERFKESWKNLINELDSSQ